MALKVFNLRCDVGHGFEGWFRSSEDYEDQRAQGRLSCPMCGSHVVTKALSAPYVSTGAASAPAVQAAAMPTPAQMQALFVKMAREIAANTEDVGERFAEEARRIHYKEVEERGIRGRTSKEEAAALVEEGIHVVPLPFGDLLKEPLQ